MCFWIDNCYIKQYGTHPRIHDQSQNCTALCVVDIPCRLPYFGRHSNIDVLIGSIGSVAAAEAGSDPRGHLWVTWGVYLCAGKPPLADIILSHPPDLTRCDSVIGLAIPAMSGHIQY